MPLHTRNAHTSPSCSSTVPGGGDTWGCTLRGKEASLDLALSLKGGDSHQAEAKPQVTPGSGPRPFVSNHTSYQGDSYQHALRKDVTRVQVKSSSSLQSHWAHANCMGVLPHNDTLKRFLYEIRRKLSKMRKHRNLSQSKE